MRFLLLVVAWFILLVVCWPIALALLFPWPILFVIALPFLVIGVVIWAAFALLKAILFLPARILS